MTRQKRSISPLRLAYNTGEFQFGDLSLPAEAARSSGHPVVILIHGGYWRARYRLDLMKGLAENLALLGIAAWNIEYRCVGNPGGGWPGTFLDAAHATDYLKQLAPAYELDLSRVVSIGHSAGGHLAFWLAARSQVSAESSIGPHKQPLALAGAISLAGVLDLNLAYQLHLSNDAVVELLAGTPDEVPERYAAASPATLLPLNIPQVVIHGDKDEDVPIQISQQYVLAARAVGDTISYFELEGVDHFAVIDARSGIWALIMQELDHLFGRR